MTRLRKEVLGLASLWGVGFLLCLTPLAVDPTGPFSIVRVPSLAISCALLSIAVFGRELGVGTLSLLLVQPVSRRRLWLEKSLPAALGAAVLALLWGMLHARQVGWRGEVLAYTLLIPAACLGPGIFLTLWLRQVSGILDLCVPYRRAPILMKDLHSR